MYCTLTEMQYQRQGWPFPVCDGKRLRRLEASLVACLAVIALQCKRVNPTGTESPSLFFDSALLSFLLRVPHCPHLVCPEGNIKPSFYSCSRAQIIIIIIIFFLFVL